MIKAQLESTLNSYWDNRFKRTAVTLLPGDFFACKGEQILITVLGSCIAVCLYETELKIGGMNHFILPQAASDELSNKKVNNNEALLFTYQHSKAARYGNTAMELLINEIIKLGGHRKNLIAKLFGGSSMNNTANNTLRNSSINIGQKNIDFIYDYLAIENIPVVSKDLGGYQARKVYFVATKNEVYVKTINNHDNKTIIQYAYADNSGIYYNRHLRNAFIEDLVLFDVDSRLKDCGKDDPEPSA